MTPFEFEILLTPSQLTAFFVHARGRGRRAPIREIVIVSDLGARAGVPAVDPERVIGRVRGRGDGEGCDGGEGGGEDLHAMDGNETNSRCQEGKRRRGPKKCLSIPNNKL